MIRGDDPVTLVNEKHETQFHKRYIVAQPHELPRLRAPVEPVTQRRQNTGPRSGSVTEVTPSSMMTKTGHRRHQVVTCSPVPATEQVKGVGRRHRLQQRSHNAPSQHLTGSVPTGSNRRPVANVDRAVTNNDELIDR